jgi:TRAP transporter 4TM/12TM fusion protein
MVDKVAASKKRLGGTLQRDIIGSDTKVADTVVDIFAVALAVLAVYVAGFGVFDNAIVSGGTVALGIVVGFLTLAVRDAGASNRLRAIAHAGLAVLWLVLAWDWLNVMFAQEAFFIEISRSQNIQAWIAFAVVGYLTYRHFGPSMLAVYSLAGLYVLAPASWGGAGENWLRVAENLWFSTDGVYGRPVEVVSRIVLIFIVFGAVLQTSGAGDVLLKVAFAATGRVAGGPAHAAVVGSAAFGLMSGSAIANVVSTGVFTIPIIKKAGFKAKFAGAVEAAASTGGQIMPPVMGVVAFLMADMTGIPYLQVVVAAAIPAAMFYASLFAVVLIEARRQGIAAIPPDERVRLVAMDFVRCLAFFVPLVVIVAVLVNGRTPQFAGYVALIAATLLCLVLFPGFRSPVSIWRALASAGRTAATLMIIVAAIGFVIGVINMTGLGLRFAELILAVAGSSLFVALVVVMLGCLVMGMGVPSGAAYLIIALVMGPALQRLGLPSIAAHLFIVYFGVLSVVTPPVALAAFAAAPIAGSNPMETGLEATRLSVAGFIIPFVFVYHPDILIIEGVNPFLFAWALVAFAIAGWSIASALSGFDVGPLPAWERLVRAGLGILAIFPDFIFALPGALGCAILFARHRLNVRMGSRPKPG